MKKLVVLICMAGVLWAGCGGELSVKGIPVDYTVQSPSNIVKSVNIKYQDWHGIRYAKNVSLPWTYRFSGNRGDFLLIEAKSSDIDYQGQEGGVLWASIYVNSQKRESREILIDPKILSRDNVECKISLKTIL